MHEFEIDGKRYTDSRSIDNAFDDFGDGWEHSVILENVTNAAAGEKYPRCTAGRGACPPEDGGGVFGFAEYLRRDRFEKVDQGTFWLSETLDEVGSKGWDAAMLRIASWVV